jgi:enoyl-CoA hydratase/carnithine racemase
VAVVEYNVAGRVAELVLNRPERLNAEVPALVDGLLDGFAAATRDRAGAIVLAGNGRAFCAGHDLKAPEPDDADDNAARARLQRIQDVTRAIRDFDGIVVAAVHGYALGAGCEFALGCDLVVAGQDAQFGFPEVGVGLSVTGGISALLPRAVGLARAKELLVLGERFGAADALAMGLVNAVVRTGEHRKAARELAQRCADQPAGALRLAKRVLDHGAVATFEAALDLEVEHAIETLHSGESETARDRFR